MFWIMDSHSSHRGKACAEGLKAQWPTIIPLYTLVYGSGLHQVETCFAIVQREELADALLGFGRHWETVVAPLEWKLARRDLADLLARPRAASEIMSRAT